MTPETGTREIDDLFDRAEGLLSTCDRSRARERALQLVGMIDAIDASLCSDTNSVHAALVHQAQRVMTEHLNDPLTITEIAHACSTSPTMLKQTFRAVTGLPVYQWYRKHRIDRAKELLEHSSLPVAQIATAVGYANPSKFSKAFRDEAGTTPNQWRFAHTRGADE